MAPRADFSEAVISGKLVGYSVKVEMMWNEQRKICQCTINNYPFLFIFLLVELSFTAVQGTSSSVMQPCELSLLLGISWEILLSCYPALRCVPLHRVRE